MICVAWEWPIFNMRVAAGCVASNAESGNNSYALLLYAPNRRGKEGHGHFCYPFSKLMKMATKVAQAWQRRHACVYNRKCTAWISWIIGFIYALRIWKTWTYTSSAFQLISIFVNFVDFFAIKLIFLSVPFGSDAFDSTVLDSNRIRIMSMTKKGEFPNALNFDWQNDHCSRFDELYSIGVRVEWGSGFRIIFNWIIGSMSHA